MSFLECTSELSGLLLIGIFVCLWTSPPSGLFCCFCNPRRILEALEQQFANRQLIEPIFSPRRSSLGEFRMSPRLYSVPLTNDDGFFVAENSSTKTTQAQKKKEKKKNSRCERQWIVYIDPVSSSYRKRVFWENEREFFFFICWSRRTPSDVVVLVPLSSAQGWLDAYFVNIRTCEVKRNIQKGTNKPKREKRKKNNLWT